MEFIINAKEFSQAISAVNTVISPRATPTILSGIKIVVTQDQLILTGSNADVFIEKKILLKASSSLRISRTGSTVVSSIYLTELTKKLPDEIHFTMKDEKIVWLQSGEITSKLNVLPIHEYPSLPEISLNQSIQMKCNVLVDIISQTIFAASTSETRPVLTGIHLSFQKGYLTCTATNSQRLASRKIKIDTPTHASCIVPRTSLMEFSKLFAKESMDIEINLTSSHIVFHSESIRLYSRLLEGSFPSIPDIIPQQKQTMIILDRKHLLEGIDRATVFAKDWKNYNIKFIIDGGDIVKLSSLSSEVGGIEENLMIHDCSGEDEVALTMDARFLKDALKSIKEDKVSLSFQGSMRPVLIEPVGKENHLQLISPVRASY